MKSARFFEPFKPQKNYIRSIKTTKTGYYFKKKHPCGGCFSTLLQGCTLLIYGKFAIIKPYCTAVTFVGLIHVENLYCSVPEWSYTLHSPLFV